MKVVYLAHPLSAPTHEGILENLARAKRWYKWACEEYWPSHAFVANWILNCEVFDDDNAEDRVRGMKRNLAVLARCDELWLIGGRISEGMKDEMMFCKIWQDHHNRSVRVWDRTDLGEEPPEYV